MRTVRLRLHHGDIDIVINQIVALRDAISSERPGATTITTADGKIHIVTETRDEVLELVAAAE